MHRYFRAFGPATLKDFCHWSGIPLRDAKGPFSTVVDEMDSVLCDGTEMYRIGSAVPATSRAVTVLGMYDPLTVSYAYKSWAGGRDVQDRIWMSAGRVGAVVVIGGMVRAVWSVRTGKGTASFRVEPVGRISEHYRHRIAARMEDIAGFLGYGYGGTGVVGDAERGSDAGHESVIHPGQTVSATPIEDILSVTILYH